MLSPGDLVYSSAGLAVGFLVGMTGVGGGSLMTPLLILLFGVHPVLAVGTDLLYASLTKSAGSAVHGVARTIDWRVVGRLATGSIPMTALSLVVLSNLDIKSSAARHLVSTALGCAMLLSALVLIFRSRIIAFRSAAIAGSPPRHTTICSILFGAILGFLVSISSVGAGALGVTGLILIYPRMSASRLVGTDIAHAVPLTLVSGIGYSLLGAVDWHLLGTLLFGSLPGIVIGSYFSARVPELILRIALSATLLLVASQLLLAA